MKKIKSKKKPYFLVEKSKVKNQYAKNRGADIKQVELGVFYPAKTSLKKHCKIYNLEPKEGACENCGSTVKTNMPFFTKDYVGLKCNPCIECGEYIALSIAKPFSKKTKQLWEKLGNLLKSNSKDKFSTEEF